MMKNKKLLLPTLFLTSALLLGGCGQTASQQDPTTSTSTTTEQDTSDSVSDNTTDTSGEYTSGVDTFSKLSTTDLDNNPVDASVFAKNKITLVNVWNVGCTPCINEIPYFDQLNKEYEGTGAAILGLYEDFGVGISDDEMSQIKDILANADASYTQLRIDGTLAQDDMILNIMVFPTTYVVNSEGTIIGTIEGSNDYEGWKATIDSYLDQAAS